MIVDINQFPSHSRTTSVVTKLSPDYNFTWEPGANLPGASTPLVRIGSTGCLSQHRVQSTVQCGDCLNSLLLFTENLKMNVSNEGAERCGLSDAG